MVMASCWWREEVHKKVMFTDDVGIEFEKENLWMFVRALV
jgi:hypothetical protein